MSDHRQRVISRVLFLIALASLLGGLLLSQWNSVLRYALLL